MYVNLTIKLQRNCSKILEDLKENENLTITYESLNTPFSRIDRAEKKTLQNIDLCNGVQYIYCMLQSTTAE